MDSIFQYGFVVYSSGYLQLETKSTLLSFWLESFPGSEITVYLVVM